MRKVTVYTCEFCGKEYDSACDCQLCEESHIESYERSSNKELIEMIHFLGERAYDHRIGSSVMGIHINSFYNLMREVAKRLKELEE